MSRQRLNASGKHYIGECTAVWVGVFRCTQDAARLVNGVCDSATLRWQRWQARSQCRERKHQEHRARARDLAPWWR